MGVNQVRTSASGAKINQASPAGRGATRRSPTTSSGELGPQITAQALIALGVFLSLVMLLIWAYFRDFKMSISAIVALLHDLVVTVGLYALVGFSVTPATMIGVLTILGYSLYDTVVVFDKKPGA